VLHFVNDSAAVTRNYESDAHSDDSEGEIDQSSFDDDNSDNNVCVKMSWLRMLTIPVTAVTNHVAVGGRGYTRKDGRGTQSKNETQYEEAQT